MSEFNKLVAEITEYLSRPGILKNDIDPASYAVEIVSKTEIRDGELSFEIPGRYTVDGNPNSCSFNAVAYAAEQDAETE